MNAKAVMILVASLFVVGCTSNQIVIENEADAAVEFHFRGEEYSIPSGSVQTIEEIPSGEYAFSTVYTIPAGFEGAAGDGLSGSMQFLYNGTQARLNYVSVTDSTTYTVSAVFSSSDPSSFNIVE